MQNISIWLLGKSPSWCECKIKWTEFNYNIIRESLSIFIDCKNKNKTKKSRNKWKTILLNWTQATWATMIALELGYYYECHLESSLSPWSEAIPFFSLFGIVWPTHIFAFSKKKKRGWKRQWHIISKNCHFNLKNSQCFVSFFSLFTFEFNHDFDLSFPQYHHVDCWLV